MKALLLNALAALLPLAAIADNVSQPATQQDELTPQSVEQFFDAAWPTLEAGGKIPGAAVAVVRGDQVLLAKGYGVRDLSSGAPLDPLHTPLQIGSLSKVFTAVAALTLVDEGKLSLDANVNDYLDAFKVPDTYPQPVTILNLLTHTSGFDSDLSGFLVYSRDELDVPPHEYQRHLIRMRPQSQVMSYDNVAVALLGHIVGARDGSDYAGAITRRIFEPLGMTGSAVGMPANRSDVPACHNVDANGKVGFCRQQFMRKGYQGAGAITVTASDMTRFMRALIAGGTFEGKQLLQPATFAKLVDVDRGRVHPDLPGIGLIIAESNIAGRQSLGHTGGFDGFSTRMDLYMHDGVGVFISLLTYPGLPAPALTAQFVIDGMQKAGAQPDAYGAMRKVNEQFAKRFLPPTPKPAARPAAHEPPFAQIAGRYHFIRRNAYPLIDKVTQTLNGNLDVRTESGDRLYVSERGPFVRTHPGLFERSQDGSRWAVTEVDGRPILSAASGLEHYVRMPWYDRPAITIYPLLAAMALLLISGLYLWARSSPSPEVRRLGKIAAAGVALLIVGIALELQYFPTLYFLDKSPIWLALIRIAIHAGWIAAALVAWLAFRNRDWLGSFHTGVLIVAGAIVVLLLPYWGVIGSLPG